MSDQSSDSLVRFQTAERLFGLGSNGSGGNSKLKIDGVLVTMVDNRTTYAKEISALLRDTYGAKLKVFATDIPHFVRAAEISAEGKSIYIGQALHIALRKHEIRP